MGGVRLWNPSGEGNSPITRVEDMFGCVFPSIWGKVIVAVAGNCKWKWGFPAEDKAA